MRSLFFSTLAACLFLVPPLAFAVDYPYTTFSALEAVYDDGQSAYGGSGPISLVGVVINNPLDMLDGAMQWQTYVQALPAGTYGGYTVVTGDFGGAAMYMTKYFTDWSHGYPPTVSQLYNDVEWSNEMDRLNYPGDPTKLQPSLRYGDVVVVRAGAPGLFYGGKFNINEQHDASPSKDFSITILDHGTTPAAADITLAKLKDISNQYIFAENRATGCEHYQGSLVTLSGLQLVDPNASWTANSTVVVKQLGADGITRTFDLLLGLDSGLLSKNPHSSLFDVTAILDQEDGTAPYTGGYRLWLTSASLLTVPEPGTLVLLVSGLIGLAAYAWRKRK